MGYWNQVPEDIKRGYNSLCSLRSKNFARAVLGMEPRAELMVLYLDPLPTTPQPCSEDLIIQICPNPHPLFLIDCFLFLFVLSLQPNGYPWPSQNSLQTGNGNEGSYSLEASCPAPTCPAPCLPYLLSVPDPTWHSSTPGLLTEGIFHRTAAVPRAQPLCSLHHTPGL
jgi:hypothetical protein